MIETIHDILLHMSFFFYEIHIFNLYYKLKEKFLMIGSFKNHCDEGVAASVIELVEECCFLRGIETTITKSPIGVGFIGTHQSGFYKQLLSLLTSSLSQILRWMSYCQHTAR